MPVPGLNPELPVKAKVRVGERQEVKPGKVLPVSTDHFVCDDDTFVAVAGENPKSIRVHFPYAEWQLCFPSGLERWVKGRTNQILTCYTKGDGIAHRLTKGLKAPDGTWKMDPTVLADRSIEQKRREMPCAAQACGFFGKGKTQGCRPQARLNFQLVDGPRDSIYRFETKGLNTIERIEGVLRQYPDLRGVEFQMSVEVVKRGAKEFPVVTLREAVTLTPEQTQAACDRMDLEQLLKAHDRWPMSAVQEAWVERVGIAEALRALREKVANG